MAAVMESGRSADRDHRIHAQTGPVLYGVSGELLVLVWLAPPLAVVGEAAFEAAAQGAVQSGKPQLKVRLLAVIAALPEMFIPANCSTIYMH